MSEDEKNCYNCRFYSDGFPYVCLRHAPVVSLVDMRNPEKVWPPVRQYDWCGDHEPISKQKESA